MLWQEKNTKLNPKKLVTYPWFCRNLLFYLFWITKDKITVSFCVLSTHTESEGISFQLTSWLFHEFWMQSLFCQWLFVTRSQARSLWWQRQHYNTCHIHPYVHTLMAEAAMQGANCSSGAIRSVSCSRILPTCSVWSQGFKSATSRSLNDPLCLLWLQHLWPRVM